MIIEILTIIMSSLFVLASWSFQDSDDFVPNNLEMDREKNISQMASLASAATIVESKPKKKISEIDDLLGTTKTKEEKPKKETSEIDDLLGATKEKKEKPKKVKPKKETVKIECPGCNSIMELQKTGKMQDIVCKSCGLEGELEV
tara:strand:+ start:819 stop:1253 length:435 start_codon:yes stop_codon:yes gene_type:complete